MEKLNYPVTIAKEPINDVLYERESRLLTITKKHDENKLYSDLSYRLLMLEETLTINYKELNLILESSKNFNVEINFKKNIIKHVNSISHLYQVWENIPHIETGQQAEKIIKTLSIIQTNPLKKEIKKELEIVANSYQTTETSQINQFMDLAIDQAGDEFINLNSAGREYIITELVKQYQNKATLQQVKEYTTYLNKQSNQLKQIENVEQFQEDLEKLPLNFYHTIPIDHKCFIINKLIKQKEWNGLASLEALITKFNNELIKKEDDIKKRKKSKALKEGYLTTLDYTFAKDQSIISTKG